jgi:hypothetical protein
MSFDFRHGLLGIVTDGSSFKGGLDGHRNCYSANLLGSVVVINGLSFALGPANVLNTVSNATVALPMGQFSYMMLLATGVNGNQASQSLSVNYTDGTSTTYVQGFSDWSTPQNYAGEGVAATMAYRDSRFGTEDKRTSLLYRYSFVLNGAKTVRSVVLPANSNVVVVSVTLGGSSSPPATYTISGIVSGSAATLTLSGTSSGSTSTSASGNYSFSGLLNGSYVIAPSQSGYAFTPSTALITINSGSKTGVNFTAAVIPVQPPVSHSVSLTWNPSTSTNISGYNVYRAGASGGPYTKLNSSLLAATSLLDSNVVAGQTYYYVATALQGTTESTYSNQAKAIVPTP